MNDSKHKNIIIGIDPSISSTGVCVKQSDRYEYYLICAKPTKKMLSLDLPNLHITPYKYMSQTGLSGIDKEHAKSNNVCEITRQTELILQKFRPVYIIMEAVAFQANGTIDQLAGLNYTIRYLASNLQIPCYAISPSAVKKESVGDGGALKETMIRAWQNTEPSANSIINHLKKCDDLADSYHMANFPLDPYIQ